MNFATSITQDGPHARGVSLMEVKGSALWTTYLVAIKPVLQSTTKIAGAAHAANFSRSLLICGPDGLNICYPAIVKRAGLPTCDHITLSNEEDRHGCSRRRCCRRRPAAGDHDRAARGPARGRSAGRNQGHR